MKHTALFSVLAALLLTFSWANAAEDTMADLSSGIIRLHILANSDSEADQSLKQKVRDSLLLASKENPATLTEAEILCICQAEIQKNGYDYPVTVERGRFFFPKKTYDCLTLPAGEYDAVRVKIGAAAGQNWWCVMYPPLCFSGDMAQLDEESLQKLKSTMKGESFAVISQSETITVKPSFKLVELWQDVKSIFK